MSPSSRPRRHDRPRRPPLDEAELRDLALRYVGRFATSRAKLRSYLQRKIRERGWAGAGEVDLVALADRFADSGYVDDAGFALGKARSLAGRGYGKRRLVEQLRAAGIEDDHRAAACEHADEQAVAAALRFAERRRIGPFAAAAADRAGRDKAISAMIRAGHGFGLARAIVALEPGASIEPDALSDQAGLRLL
ncbi:MAG: RecX family transcriptional regulator [Sphingomicrobium sp.]